MSKLTLEKKVRAVMTMDEESRNDDIRLTKIVWWKYHSLKLFKHSDGELSVRLKDLQTLPREDGIKRVRAHIQNDLHELVPTNKKVAEKRGMQEVEWRQYLGYPTEDTL